MLLTTTGFAVPIDISGSDVEITGATTMTITGIEAMGGDYWADFAWNANTNKFDVTGYGEEGGGGDPYHIGWDEEFPNNSSHSPNYLLGSVLTVDDGCNLTHLSVIAKSAGDNVKMALYDDNGGNPGNLVAQTGVHTTSVGVMEMDVLSPVDLAPGDYYIMGVYETQASIGLRTNTGEGVWYRSMSFHDSMPNPFGSPSFYTDQVFNYYMVVN